MGKEIIKVIKEIFYSLLDVIYPAEERCIVCNNEDAIGLCPNCRKKIKRVNLQDEIISYGYYGGPLKELILAFKYDKNFTAGETLSDFLVKLIKEEGIVGDFICFVPMTKSSERKRGFNQCEVIAKNISRNLDIPVRNIIRKNKNTKEQKTLSKDERFKNISGAFSVNIKKNIKDMECILIDDVVTTGATLLECKETLKKHGINKITVLTIAKSNI